MKYILCFLTIFLFSCTSKSGGEPVAETQKTAIKPVPKMEETFPFSEADKVVVISFFHMDYQPDDNNYKIQDGKVPFDESIVKESIVLDKKQQQQLFTILNTETVPKDNTMADCYMPEHRITFSKEGKVIAFLEVCLQCVGSRVSEDFTPVKLHRDKMNELQQFFRNVGIRHFSEL
jgi:hypothetical protein